MREIIISWQVFTGAAQQAAAVEYSSTEIVLRLSLSRLISNCYFEKNF